MKTTIRINNIDYLADLQSPLPIGIPIKEVDNPSCYYTEPVSIDPIRGENFIGSIREGGLVNHKRLSLAPHGNCTHTECSAHIFDNEISMISLPESTHISALLISSTPEATEAGLAIRTFNTDLSNQCQGIKALIIRSLPNSSDKLTRNYSGKNPAYISIEAMTNIVQSGIEHLVVDFPSVDPEVDGGQLSAHKIFWNSKSRQQKCTITELAYINNEIKDGLYLLNLQTLRIDLDVSPSNPILYRLSPT